MVGDHPGYGTPQFSPMKELMRRFEAYIKEMVRITKEMAQAIVDAVELAKQTQEGVGSYRLTEITVDMYKHMISKAILAFSDKVDVSRIQELLKELDEASIQDLDRIERIANDIVKELDRIADGFEKE